MSPAVDTTGVLIVDDHPLFRDALTRTIESRPGMEVVGQASSGIEAIDIALETHPQVCVLDLGLPDISGARVLERVLAECDETRVLVLSGECDSSVVYSMIEAGAAGFEVKTAGPNQLGDAIAAVARGETVLPSTLHGGLAEQIRARRIDAAVLTVRELEILTEVADGKSAGEIGSTINLSESTVKTHLTRIYDKLGVSERAAAVAYAMRHGLIN